MQFEWDETKNAGNKKKHGVSFEAASIVFFDPLALTVKDKRSEHEERWITIGMAGARILFVVHTVSEENGNEEIIRIISARESTTRERKLYSDDR